MIMGVEIAPPKAEPYVYPLTIKAAVPTGVGLVLLFSFIVWLYALGYSGSRH
jgi:hypothetical protein